MAKKEEIAEQTALQNEATEVAVVKPSDKKVKIHATEPIDCIIAGTAYKMVKDKEYSVPKDVAAILVNSKKAYRL